jgi:hypothetical protein
MRSGRVARLRAGIGAGLLASLVLGSVIWLFGYITGYRLAISILYIAALCAGVIAGAQVLLSRPEELNKSDEALAELERQAENKALRASGKLRR